jgi:hypothetical protein
MLTDTDCAVRFATHARQVARTNQIEWMRPVDVPTSHSQMRRWLATTLISLGTRIAPASADEPSLLGLADVSGGRIRNTLRG